MDNMKIYEAARAVPQEALKTIQAGRLKGMSDINPMFRIKRLTEMFGPCGVGWWYEITRKEIVYDEELTNQKCAFVDINLYYVDPETGHESHAIPGTGGASFVATERNGPYMSDECYKMALTDAISVAAKALGVAADVYYKNDRSKYTKDTLETEQPPADGLQQGEKMNFQKAGSWNPMNAATIWCKNNGVKIEDLNKWRNSLIEGGIVPKIDVNKLTPEQFDQLISAVQANYTGQLKVSA